MLKVKENVVVYVEMALLVSYILLLRGLRKLPENNDRINLLSADRQWSHMLQLPLQTLD
jgi:hypothetical protein